MKLVYSFMLRHEEEHRCEDNNSSNHNNYNDYDNQRFVKFVNDLILLFNLVLAVMIVLTIIMAKAMAFSVARSVVTMTVAWQAQVAMIVYAYT